MRAAADGMLVMKNFLGAAARFVKREAVLCIAVLLAVISMFFVPPNAGYADYIDWDTLALLFALMAVMKGFQRAGLFDYLANKLLKRANTSKKLMAVLVFAPFFLSMVVTNDVSLITFVPFALIVLKSAGLHRLILPTVVLQTLAANLGSMLTPIGNPQNLYLYNASGMSFGELVLTMLPYVALSGIGLLVAVLLFKSSPVGEVEVQSQLKGAFALSWPAVFFVCALLGLFDVIPTIAVAAAVLLFLLVADRKTLAKIDYSLLGTFVAFFIFIGNMGNIQAFMGNIQAFRTFLSSVIEGNEVIVAVLASQVISNVPAALLLSGFSAEWPALVVGCNIGGLGTLIASMASLISYKSIARECPERRGAYIVQFTIFNIIFLASLYVLSLILSA